jgi:hypothetical protein
LHSLDLDIWILGPSQFVRLAVAILSKIPSPNIENLRFTVEMASLDELEMVEWQTLAQALALPTFSRLHCIEFEFEFEEEADKAKAVDIIKIELADCVLRGVLVRIV